MKIQKGIVKYKDRNDIVCVYGVSDDGIQYYFLDENEDKKMSNGNRIASTALVEAVDAMFKATRIGVISKDGKVVIPFENKAIKLVNDQVLIVEKATPTSQNVLDAIEKRNDTSTAASLVAASAAIKDKMNAKMGPEGRFLVNDQFSEATVCDSDGNNLVNDEYYSFIGCAGDKLYFSKNIPESDIIEFSLENKSIIEADKSNEVIDVQNTEVDPQSVESALSDEVNNEKVLVKQPENTVSPVVDANSPLDLADFFKGEGVPAGEEVKGDMAADISNALNAPIVDSETVKETVEGKEEVSENKEAAMPPIPGVVEEKKEEAAPVDIPPVVDAMNNSEISPLDMPPVVNEEDTKEEISPLDMPPVVDAEETKEEVNPQDLPPVEEKEEAKDEVNPMDMPPVEDKVEAKEEISPLDMPPVVDAEEAKEEVNPQDLPPVEEKEDTKETMDMPAVPDVVTYENEEKTEAVDDVAAINLNNPVSFNPNDLSKLSDDTEDKGDSEESVSVPPIDSIKDEEKEKEQEVEIPAPVEDEKPVAEDVPDVSREEIEDEKPVEFNNNVTSIDPSDVATAVDKDNDGVLDSDQSRNETKSSVIDDIDLDLGSHHYDSLNDIDNYDYHENSSNDNLMNEVSHYMMESMKIIKDQKSTIKEKDSAIIKLQDYKRELTDRLKDQVSKNESLAGKLRSLDSLTTKLETKVKDQSRIIESQERELKSLRNQLNSKREVAQLLDDFKVLIDENESYNDGDSYLRRSA